MSDIPTLYTPRLVLRPFGPADARRVQELAGDRRIAAGTALIPHPYPDGAADAWIATHQGAARENKQFNFAITLAGTRTPGRERDLADTGHLIGSIGLFIDPNHARADLGYWIGVPYWNKGFTTEAGHAVLSFGFSRLALYRVTAHHFTSNPASGNVLKKLGMTCEGTFRRHHLKWGEYLDVACFAILREEWLRQHKTPRLPARALQTA